MANPNPKNDGTRERLIQAGLTVFGEHGFNGSTTRMLAAKAGANLAAIPYHFGGKQGLYLAVAEYVADRIAEHLLPVVEEINESFDNGMDRTAALDHLHALYRNFARLIICNEEADTWAALIMREQANPTEAFDVLYNRVMVHVAMASNRLVGMIIGKPIDDPETALLATTLLGQIMIFRTSRATVLRRLGWKNYDRKNTVAILDVIDRNIDACLGVAS